MRFISSMLVLSLKFYSVSVSCLIAQKLVPVNKTSHSLQHQFPRNFSVGITSQPPNLPLAFLKIFSRLSVWENARFDTFITKWLTSNSAQCCWVSKTQSQIYICLHYFPTSVKEMSCAGLVTDAVSGSIWITTQKPMNNLILNKISMTTETSLLLPRDS